MHNNNCNMIFTGSAMSLLLDTIHGYVIIAAETQL